MKTSVNTHTFICIVNSNTDVFAVHELKQKVILTAFKKTFKLKSIDLSVLLSFGVTSAMCGERDERKIICTDSQQQI